MPGLWGTRARCVAGHFMGKKSVSGTPHLDVPGQPAVPMAFGPSLRALLEDVVELLTRELLKILLQERLLDENRGKYDLTDQVNIGWYEGRCPKRGGSGDRSTALLLEAYFLCLLFLGLCPAEQGLVVLMFGGLSGGGEVISSPGVVKEHLDPPLMQRRVAGCCSCHMCPFIQPW